MRKVLIVFIATLCAAGLAFAKLGDVVASWASPNSTPCAVAASNSYIYVFTTGGGGMIYTMNMTTGSVVRSFTAVNGTSMRGLAYVSGDHLWQGKSSSPAYFYDTNANTGSINRSISSPSNANRSLAPLCTGDGGTGTTALLSSNYSQQRLYVINMTNGSVISTCSIPQMYDIAYDWRSKLIWGGMNTITIYGCTTTGSTVASFSSPAGSPYGMAYHGQYLYVVTLSSSGGRQVWKIHCPQINVGVRPSSMGKIKATYR
jgi:hypothetical protein